MQVLTSPRLIAAIAGLVGVVVSLVYPAAGEEKAIAFTSMLLTFLAGLYQPAPGAKPKELPPGVGQPGSPGPAGK